MKGYFPNTTVNLEMLPKEMQEKMFPEYVIYKNAKGRDKEFYDQFLAGLQAGTTEISNDDVDGEITPTELLSLVDVEKEKEEEQQLQPPTPQPAFAVNQAPTLNTSLTGVEFGTLFPDDPMGQMIAERRQKRNEQSG